jgi:tetratricopeptide (TPR) repeat protein
MNMPTDAGHQLCFVDMPFGKKTDARTGIEIDFDQIYTQGIKPAVEAAGLECIRGDEERTGGIIHTAMFARLLLCEFVIADLTTANPNVFYELGVRHAAKPYTTIPIFATTGGLPFDVNLVRAIPYDLENGQLTDAAAQRLQQSLQERIRRVLEGPVAEDSPLFQLFKGFPGIEVSHELTDVFRDRVVYSQEFRDKLAAARVLSPREEAINRLQAIEGELGDLRTVESGILVDMLLSYRDVSAWDQMVSLYERLPAHVKEAVLVRQQFALALNRRAQPGDRQKAIRILETLLQERGESAETYGILGRVYKDLYREEKDAEKLTATVQLDKAIEAYTKGFECEPVDYYPGVNAITLLLQKGTEEAQQQAERLTPLVSFAVARKGGASSNDYWTLATVLELALIGREEKVASSVLPRVLAAAEAGWMAKTTADNLEMVLRLRRGKEETSRLEGIISELRKRQQELGG